MIAAACAYGDDPVAALTAKHNVGRRCLTPAIGGLVAAGQAGPHRLCQLFGLSKNALAAARCARRPGFAKAEAAATEAVRYALRTQVLKTQAVVRPNERVAFDGSSLRAANLGDRILAVLADGAQTSVSLATLLDVKETMIGQQLSLLRHAGRVADGEVPAEGRRHVRWRLTP